MDNEEIRELLKELKETSDESTAVRSRVVKIHFDTRQEAERRARAREKAREEAERQREKEEQEEKERQRHSAGRRRSRRKPLSVRQKQRHLLCFLLIFPPIWRSWRRKSLKNRSRKRQI